MNDKKPTKDRDWLSQELEKVSQWYNTESDKVIARLESEGKPIGLDGYVEEFAPIKAEVKRRLKLLREKYHAPD